MELQIGFCTNPDGARIAYGTMGQGPEWVIPPGYSASITPINTIPEIRKNVSHFAPYHTLVFYDQVGAGLSDRNRTVFTLESELQDLETVINHLNLDPVILKGQAMSGPVAIAYAAKYPERVTHLILYGTSVYYGKYVPDEVKAAMLSLIRQPDNWLGRRAMLSLYASQAQIETLELLVAMTKDIATPEVLANLMDMSYKLDVRHLCPLIKAPTLVMHRKGDPLYDFKAGLELASLIPNARFVPLEGDMHFYVWGDTESFERNEHEFLGDPLPNKADDNAAKVASLSLVAEPKPEQKKLDWLRVDNPLVYIIVTIVASVIAGAILTLFKC